MLSTDRQSTDMAMKAVVIGAGIAGLTAAMRLRAIGWEPIVIERAPAPRGAGYMIDFFGAGFDAAERLGLRPQLEAIHRPVDELRYVDARGRLRFAVPYTELRRHVFRGRHVNMLRGDLERVLRESADVPIRLGTVPLDVRPDATGVSVVLDDGTEERADLLVGADGVHSVVRSLVCGPEPAFRIELGHLTAAYMLDTLPAGVPERSFTTVTGRGAMAALYPVSGGRAAAFFVHRTSDARAEAADDPGSVLRHRYAELGWVVPSLLAAVPAQGVYLDEVMQIRAPRWHTDRVVLLGDAAWCVSLLAGQGASLAVAGADRLASALADCSDVPMALGAWERSLRPLVESVQAAGRRTAAYFVPADPVRAWLRDMALRASAWPVASRVARRSLVVT